MRCHCQPRPSPRRRYEHLMQSCNCCWCAVPQRGTASGPFIRAIVCSPFSRHHAHSSLSPPAGSLLSSPAVCPVRPFDWGAGQSSFMLTPTAGAWIELEQVAAARTKTTKLGIRIELKLRASSEFRHSSVRRSSSVRVSHHNW